MKQKEINDAISEWINKDNRNSIPFPELVAEMAKYYKDVPIIDPTKKKFTEEDMVAFAEWIHTNSYWWNWYVEGWVFGGIETNPDLLKEMKKTSSELFLLYQNTNPKDS